VLSNRRSAAYATASAATTLGVRDARLRPRVDRRQRTLTLRLGLFDLDYLEFGLDVAGAGEDQLAPAGRPRTTDRHGNCDGLKFIWGLGSVGLNTQPMLQRRAQ